MPMHSLNHGCNKSGTNLGNDIVNTVRTIDCSKPRPTVDLSRMESKDLKDLHQRDAFLYYSIPEVRHALVRGGQVDHEKLAQRFSSPDSVETRQPHFSGPRNESTATSTTVKRSSCISFECHPDLLMGELLGFDTLEAQEDEESDVNDPLDFLLAMMQNVRDENIGKEQKGL
ncbi:hypothetical protein ACHAWF_001440 [Thalassiosira exigua]